MWTVLSAWLAATRSCWESYLFVTSVHERGDDAQLAGLKKIVDLLWTSSYSQTLCWSYAQALYADATQRDHPPNCCNDASIFHDLVNHLAFGHLRTSVIANAIASYHIGYQLWSALRFLVSMWLASTTYVVDLTGRLNPVGIEKDRCVAR